MSASWTTGTAVAACGNPDGYTKQASVILDVYFDNWHVIYVEA